MRVTIKFFKDFYHTQIYFISIYTRLH